MAILLDLGSRVPSALDRPSTGTFRVMTTVETRELHLETQGVLCSTSPKPFNPSGL